MALAAFLAAHLANHLVGLRGVAAHQAFMEAARLVYRSAVLEPLLLAAVLVQIATRIAQIRAGWGTRRSFWARTQAASGLYLAFFLANHTFWVLVSRIGFGLDSNFYLAATFVEQDGTIQTIDWNAEGEAQTIYVMRNPDKLRHVSRMVEGSSTYN